MSVLQSKKDIEQLIYDSWNYTDIHWSGVEFDISNRDEWVRCQYEPSNINHRGICNTELKYDGIVKFAIFTKSEFRSYELLDILVDLFNNKKVGSNFETGINILDTGKTDDRLYYYVDSEVLISGL